MNLENHQNYNCEITTDSGETFKVYANWIHNNKLDSWRGWNCQAGTTRIYINKQFDLFGGECKNDYLGNALGEFNILNGTICKRDTCTGCTDDLLVAKSNE